MEIHRGDIYFYSYERGYGSEQMGKRPCIIISNDLNNKYSTNVTIIPVTGAKKKQLPTHVYFSTVLISGTALAEQITTISKDRLDAFCGSLNDNIMAKIEKAIGIQLWIEWRAKNEAETK